MTAVSIFDLLVPDCAGTCFEYVGNVARLVSTHTLTHTHSHTPNWPADLIDLSEEPAIWVARLDGNLAGREPQQDSEKVCRGHPRRTFLRAGVGGSQFSAPRNKAWWQTTAYLVIGFAC